MLGDTASVVTVILFVVYIIGRFWSLRRAMMFMQEDFDVMNISSSNSDAITFDDDFYFELLDNIDAESEGNSAPNVYRSDQDVDKTNVVSNEKLDTDSFLEICIEERGEIISIKSKSPMLWFKVLRIPYDDEYDEIPRAKEKVELEVKRTIPENAPIYIRTEIPEGMPKFRFCYQRADYIICKFDIGYNGRKGGMSPWNYHLKPTLLSYLYHFFRN